MESLHARSQLVRIGAYVILRLPLVVLLAFISPLFLLSQERTTFAVSLEGDTVHFDPQRLAIPRWEIPDGKIYVIDSAGTVLAQETYLDHLRNGLSMRRYVSGQIKESRNYHFSHPHGPFVSYYPNGQVKEKGEYHMGAKVGIWQGFFEDGKGSYRGGYDKWGDRLGEWVFSLPSGNKERVLHYADGLLDGPAIKLSKEGDTLSIGTWEKGYPVGYWKYFFPYGNVLQREGAYGEFGLEVGEWSFYHPTGKLESKGSFQKGRKEGEWSFYDEMGKPQLEGGFKKGLRHGLWLIHADEILDYCTSVKYVKGKIKRFYR